MRVTFAEEAVYVAMEDGELAGFLSFYQPANFVHSLFVERRGRGIGLALLNHIAMLADGPLTLRCSEPNTEAMAFYTHLGWREVERGEDGGIGWRKLRAPAP